MKPSSELFNHLIKKVEPLIKGEGFSKRGTVFYSKNSGNWEIIEFQKSQSGDVDTVAFTINLAIASIKLMKFFDPDRQMTLPERDERHWDKRIGLLLPSREDKWWVLSNKNSMDEVVNVISSYLIILVIPELKKFSSDLALRDLWLSGISPGLTEVQRLLNLTVLLTHLGPMDALPEVIERLKVLSAARPTEAMVQTYLKKLEKK